MRTSKVQKSLTNKVFKLTVNIVCVKLLARLKTETLKIEKELEKTEN